MPRRRVLSAAEQTALTEIPTDSESMKSLYLLDASELSLVRQHRGGPNRLGFALQLALLRFPGIALDEETVVPSELIRWISTQIGAKESDWANYSARAMTRWEHASKAKAFYGLSTYTVADADALVQELSAMALNTTKGAAVAAHAVSWLREAKIVLPAVSVIERACAEALTRADRQVQSMLCEPLTNRHRRQLDSLLKRREETSLTWLGWVLQAPAKAKAKHILGHIERLKKLTSLELPLEATRRVHRNRLLKLAKEGTAMTVADLAKFEPSRRHATLLAVCAEAEATILDEIIDLHERVITTLFRNAKNKQSNLTQASATAVNQKVRQYAQLGRVLLKARETGEDPFAAIDANIGWDALAESIDEATQLVNPERDDHLSLIAAQFPTLRKYSPAFLEALEFRASPAVADVLEAVVLLRNLNTTRTRKIPDTAPTAFIRPRWKSVVFTTDGIHTGFYELCVMVELKNALRSGDMWVKGSRQYRDFDDYLLTPHDYHQLKQTGSLPLPAPLTEEGFLARRLAFLNERLQEVQDQAAAGLLDSVTIVNGRLKITPHETDVPAGAKPFVSKTSGMYPRVPITDLLVEVDSWTGFSDHLPNIKTGLPAKDKQLLLAVILADGINLGLTKMAEACTGVTYAQLDRVQAHHIRDETYTSALAVLVNAQHDHPFAMHWGDGTTSSSDGQRYRASNKAEATGHVNPKYGNAPGRLLYTHVSDQYTPFYSKLVNVGDRDATHVLDGLLYHESDLNIIEHYTDTNGYSDQVFALTHLLGFRFAPRIRNLADTRLFIAKGSPETPLMAPWVGGTINTALIDKHWDEILRLSASIKTGTVTASLIVRKLSAYPRQNGLALALRELGRLERTLFTLDWIQDPVLRRRVTAGLNKGEAHNALSRAVFFHRLGEIRDRPIEDQRNRASGLTLLTAAIVLWNTVYLERTITTLNNTVNPPDPAHLKHLSPLGWDHINLTGDYTWRTTKPGKYRPVRHSKPSYR